MHTTMTELVQTDATGNVTVQVRVFADDFRTAVPTGNDPVAADSAMARYLRGTLALADRTGRPLRLAWAGAERSGDVVLLRLTGQVPSGLAGARISSLVLCERFEDQVNIVRATYGGQVATLLFTRGEVSKALP